MRCSPCRTIVAPSAKWPELVVAHLVGDRRADASAWVNSRSTERAAVLGDPQEGGAQPASGDELVDGDLAEEVEQSARRSAAR